MKIVLRNICIAVFILGMLSILGAIIAGFVFLWLEGLWYVPVAMIVFILAMIGMLNLGNTG